MATIKEDYVSYETAKLLKYKGFNEPCLSYFWSEKIGEVDYTDTPFTNKQLYNGELLRPTHQMAMKWLREAHKLHITILWDCGAYIGKNSFRYHIDRMNNYEDKGYNKIGFDSNEEAVEAAIKYCLEKLI